MQKQHILSLFCAGYLWVDAWVLLWPVKYLWIAVALAALGMCVRRARGAMIVLLIAGLLCFARWSWWQEQAGMTEAFDGREAVVQVVVLRQELMSATRQRLLLHVASSEYAGLAGQRLQAVLPRFPEFQVGQTLDSRCALKRPVDEDVPYASILAARNVFLLCEEGEFEVVQGRPAFVKHPFLWIRLFVLERIGALWPRPHGSLVRGLLLGDRADFPQKVLDDFSTAGISHIIALSGFNISVIFISLEVILLRLSLPRAWRVWLMLLIMMGFVVLVGAASSIVRAAGMGALAILGKLFGRRPSAARLLLISAAAMTIANPYILLYDAGFQLSCLATAGLLTLSDRFNAWFWFVPEFLSFRSSLATTMAASAPTLPLLMFQFGRWSLIAPVTNMLVLPLIPWLMASGAASVAISLLPFGRPIASLFAYVTALGCAYILRVSEWFAALPFAAKSISLPWPVLILSFVFLSLWMFYESRQPRSSQ